MEKKYLVIGGVGAVVLVGGFLFLRGGSGTPEPVESASDATAAGLMSAMAAQSGAMSAGSGAGINYGAIGDAVSAAVGSGAANMTTGKANGLTDILAASVSASKDQNNAGLLSQFTSAISGGGSAEVSSTATGSKVTVTGATGGAKPTFGDLANKDPMAAIEGLYKSVLGRDSDAGGLAYWTGRLAGGSSAAQIQSEFLNSAEYKQKTGQAATPAPATNKAASATTSSTSGAAGG